MIARIALRYLFFLDLFNTEPGHSLRASNIHCGTSGYPTSSPLPNYLPFSTFGSAGPRCNSHLWVHFCLHYRTLVENWNKNKNFLRASYKLSQPNGTVPKGTWIAKHSCRWVGCPLVAPRILFSHASYPLLNQGPTHILCKVSKLVHRY